MSAVDRISMFLEALGLTQYESLFRRAAIRDDDLPILTDESLKFIGISSLGHRKRILAASSAMRESPSPVPLRRPTGNIQVQKPVSHPQMEATHSAKLASSDASNPDIVEPKDGASSENFVVQGSRYSLSVGPLPAPPAEDEPSSLRESSPLSTAAANPSETQPQTVAALNASDNQVDSGLRYDEDADLVSALLELSLDDAKKPQPVPKPVAPLADVPVARVSVDTQPPSRALERASVPDLEIARAPQSQRPKKPSKRNGTLVAAGGALAIGAGMMAIIGATGGGGTKVPPTDAIVISPASEPEVARAADPDDGSSSSARADVQPDIQPPEPDAVFVAERENASKQLAEPEAAKKLEHESEPSEEEEYDLDDSGNEIPRPRKTSARPSETPRVGEIRVSDSDVPESEVTRMASVSASSTLPADLGFTFYPMQLVDGDLATSWQPSSKASIGVGEWFSLRFASPHLLSRLEVANGFQFTWQGQDLFAMNARLATVEIDLGERSQRFTFSSSERGFVEIPISPPVRTDTVTVRALSTHRGSRWPDLAVSEVKVFAVGSGQ